MKNKGKLYVLIGFAGIFALAFLFIFFNGQTKKLKAEKEANLGKITYYRKKTDNLSADKILNKMKKENINVNEALTSESNNIKAAIDLVYNQIKTDEDYKNLKSKLPKLIGKDLSSKLIELDKPVVNQSGKKNFAYSKTTNVIVTYGQYSYQTVEVPVYVVVDYEGAVDEDGKTQPGEDLFSLTYNLKTKQLRLDEYKRGEMQNE